MKAVVLSAEWAPRPGYQVSEFERTTGKAITGSSVWRYPKPGLREVGQPTPRPRDVLIEIKAIGICGSDVHFCETDQDGYMLYPGLTQFPQVIGHEFSGRIVDVGSEVRDLQPGTPVTAEETALVRPLLRVSRGRAQPLRILGGARLHRSGCDDPVYRGG